MRKKHLPKRFNEFDQVPSDPLRVLSSKAETPAEIHKRTGLRLDRLCEALVRWHQAGQITHLEIRSNYCVIPVFRIKTLFDFS